MYGWWKAPERTVDATDAMVSGFIRTPPWPISEAAFGAPRHRSRVACRPSSCAAACGCVSCALRRA